MGHRIALVVLATATVVCVLGCGSSRHQSAAPMWLHRLAQQQAHIFTQSHPSRVSRVKLTVGSKDAIELWGRFDCNEHNCSLGTCEPPDGSVQRRPNRTCVIRFRYIRLAVDPGTHRIRLVQKLRGADVSTGKLRRGPSVGGHSGTLAQPRVLDLEGCAGLNISESSLIC